MERRKSDLDMGLAIDRLCQDVRELRDVVDDIRRELPMLILIRDWIVRGVAAVIGLIGLAIIRLVIW